MIHHAFKLDLFRLRMSVAMTLFLPSLPGKMYKRKACMQKVSVMGEASADCLAANVVATDS